MDRLVQVVAVSVVTVQAAVDGPAVTPRNRRATAVPTVGLLGRIGVAAFLRATLQTCVSLKRLQGRPATACTLVRAGRVCTIGRLRSAPAL